MIFSECSFSYVMYFFGDRSFMEHSNDSPSTVTVSKGTIPHGAVVTASNLI